ncbi:hypothetical protein GCM10027614_64990 [Micromonospora vulcania]
MAADSGVAMKAAVIALLLVGAVAYAAAGADDETAGPAPGPSATQSEPVRR